MITFEKFVEKYNGKFVDYDKAFGFQCVDLIRQYILEVLGYAPYDALPAGATAKIIFNNFRTNKYFTKIINYPNNAPKKGDIIFWGYYPFVTGTAGHTAIVSDANLRTLISFDQNYKIGSFSKFVNHSYRGVLGWISPRKL